MRPSARNGTTRARRRTAVNSSSSNSRWRSKREQDELAKKLAGTETQLAALRRGLGEGEDKLRALAKTLEQKENDLAEAARQSADNATLLKLLDQEVRLVRQQHKDSQAKVAAGGERVHKLERDLENSKREVLESSLRFADLLGAKESLSKRVTVSVKDLESAKLALAALEQDKLSLLKRAAAAEKRFAGITLTGKRVIFLVDMSGSMEMLDETTFDPDKWPLVCEAVASIMRSLPELREYQVIVFSDRIKYVFGNEGRWLEYGGEASAKKVSDGLKSLKPKGGTNLQAAVQEAFRFRDTGLDTVYVFSDGLPNIGEGLPANSKDLTESQRGESLAKHIRGRLKNDWNRPLPGSARVRINCIGFFFESPDLGAFLWALARENDGSFVGMSKP